MDRISRPRKSASVGCIALVCSGTGWHAPPDHDVSCKRVVKAPLDDCFSATECLIFCHARSKLLSDAFAERGLPQTKSDRQNPGSAQGQSRSRPSWRTADGKEHTCPTAGRRPTPCRV